MQKSKSQGNASTVKKEIWSSVAVYSLNFFLSSPAWRKFAFKINQEKSENFPSEIIVDHAEVNQKLKEK